MESLKPKEQQVLTSLQKSLKMPKAKTKEGVVIAPIGLVGSGRKRVMQALAREIGATYIVADEVRVKLRNKKLPFDSTHTIVNTLATDALLSGSNVVIDSDFVDANKRNLIKKVAKDKRARAYFVRVTCNPDVMFGRMINQKYGSRSTDIFNAADTAWRGAKGAAVDKLREMWRRTPHHYTWMHDGGGKWIEKTIPQVFTTIDTTDDKAWKMDVQRLAKKLA